jgi:hypothetical protein
LEAGLVRRPSDASYIANAAVHSQRVCHIGAMRCLHEWLLSCHMMQQLLLNGRACPPLAEAGPLRLTSSTLENQTSGPVHVSVFRSEIRSSIRT